MRDMKAVEAKRGELSSSFFHSLRAKIYALGVLICLLTSLVLIAANLLGTVTALRESAERDVAFESRLLAQQLKEDYDQLQNDAFAISQVEAVAGLLRASGNGGTDPLDGSRMDQLAFRTQTIFSSIMDARSAYTQVRLIGVADCGRELVRVNREEGRLVSVPASQLQSKCTRSYFKQGIALGKGEHFFSPVTYNQERGVVQEPRIPTIRVVVPVLDNKSAVIGLVVINEDYASMLQRFAASVEIGHHMTISNANGDFLTRSSDGTVSAFMFHEDPAYPGLALHEMLQAGGNDKDWTASREGALFANARLPDSTGSGASRVVITLSVPDAVLYAPARQTLLNGLLLSVPLMLLATTATLFVSMRVMKPLTSMSRSIEEAMRTGGEPQLAVQRKDEAGMLARAFQALLDNRRSQQARQIAVIGNVYDSIVTIDAMGKILDFNPAAERLFGYRFAEVVGRDVSLLMPVDVARDHPDAMKRYRETGERYLIGRLVELDGRKADGTLFTLELSVSEITIREGESIFTGIMRDITPRKQMEVLQGEFISTVNHELRTPLTAIRAALGMLNHRISGSGDAKADTLLDSALKGAERLHELVNDILDLQKIQSGKMAYQMEVREIGALVSDAIERYQMLGESLGVRLVAELADGPLYGLLDATRFGQALGNLLSNAIKYSPRGKDVTVKVRQSNDETVRISVVDRGPGIPATFRDKIFGRFAQADGSDSRGKGGSGLGLSITKEIIENFSGKIGFESEEGHGANFVIELPLHIASCEPELGNAEQA